MPMKRRRVKEAVARKLMDDLEEVIRGYLQDADQRILDRLGHVAEATLVVSTFEDMNLCEWHLKRLLVGGLVRCAVLDRIRGTGAAWN